MYGDSLPTSETSSTIGLSPSPATGSGVGLGLGESPAARAAALRAFLRALEGLWCFGLAGGDWDFDGHIARMPGEKGHGMAALKSEYEMRPYWAE